MRRDYAALEKGGLLEWAPKEDGTFVHKMRDTAAVFNIRDNLEVVSFDRRSPTPPLEYHKESQQ